jgi:hypothetical protein
MTRAFCILLFSVTTAVAACRATEPRAMPPSAPTASATDAPRAPPESRVNPMPLGGACPAPTAPTTPIEYGECVVHATLVRAKSNANVAVVLASDPAAQGVPVETPAESYSIVSIGTQTFVVGRDAAGAMYGALAVAELLDEEGAAALPLPTLSQSAPALSVRGASLVLSLPEDARLSWFHDTAFWVDYLDLLARARLNFLDLHALFDVAAGAYTNPLPSFATAASMPEVGRPKDERETNLAMLNEVVAMAAVRSIKVGLMSYRSDLATPEQKEKETEDDRAKSVTYTREAVADLETRAPGLAFVGFRVGDSHRDVAFFESTYLAARAEAGAHPAVYTASAGTSRNALRPVLVSGGPETMVLVRYQGDQLALPYVVSGGGMQGEKSYSYEDFLSPPQVPYRFVWQMRDSATHRIFRNASYSRTRREVLSMLMSARAAGVTYEAPHNALSQKDLYHASDADSWSPYTFKRDELSYLLVGRLAYDPNTPERTFRRALAARVDTDALWEPLQAASDVAPWIAAAEACGPDQRDQAPELEVGPPASYLASPPETDGRPFQCAATHHSFDEHAIALPYEAAADLVGKKGTSRLSPVDIAQTLLADAKAARGARSAAINPANAQARDLVRECGALADLADWFAHKLRSATALAVYEQRDAAAWLETAKDETRVANTAWNALVADTAYVAPFEEKTRMRKLGLSPFHWRRELSRLDGELASIDKAVAALHKDKAAAPPRKVALPPPTTWLDAPRRPGPTLTAFDIKPDEPNAREWTVTAAFATPLPAGTSVRVLYRPFRSNGADWAPVVAEGGGASWKATVPGTKDGAMFALEVDGGPGHAYLYPDVTKEPPYRVLAP